MVNELQRRHLASLSTENPVKGFGDFLDLSPGSSKYDVNEAMRILRVLYDVFEDKNPINYCTLKEMGIETALRLTLLERLTVAELVEPDLKGDVTKYFITRFGMETHRGLTRESQTSL